MEQQPKNGPGRKIRRSKYVAVLWYVTVILSILALGASCVSILDLFEVQTEINTVHGRMLKTFEVVHTKEGTKVLDIDHSENQEKLEALEKARMGRFIYLGFKVAVLIIIASSYLVMKRKIMG